MNTPNKTTIPVPMGHFVISEACSLCGTVFSHTGPKTAPNHERELGIAFDRLCQAINTHQRTGTLCVANRNRADREERLVALMDEVWDTNTDDRQAMFKAVARAIVTETS